MFYFGTVVKEMVMTVTATVISGEISFRNE
jgi:hypothetical protein